MQTLRSQSRSICSSSTRRTACRSGGTTSARPFSSLGGAVQALGRPPVLALTATATPRVLDDIVAPARAAQSPQMFNLGMYRPNLHYQVNHTATDIAKQQRACRAAARTRGHRHRLRRHGEAVRCGGAAPREPKAWRSAGTTAASRARAPAGDAGSLHGRRAQGDRRDQRLRHGHRQTGHPVRGPLRHAGIARVVLPGVGPCGPRRRAGWLRPALPASRIDALTSSSWAGSILGRTTSSACGRR